MLLFRGKRRPLKIHPNPCHFSMLNPQANSKKESMKAFWRVGNERIFVQFDFRWGGCTCEKKICAFTKLASIKCWPKAFWIHLSTLPPYLEYFFQVFELSTKAAFAKAAFDIHSNLLYDLLINTSHQPRFLKIRFFSFLRG